MEYRSEIQAIRGKADERNSCKRVYIPIIQAQKKTHQRRTKKRHLRVLRIVRMARSYYPIGTTSLERRQQRQPSEKPPASLPELSCLDRKL